MEDIQRELEREIARSRPAPFKRNLKKKILIIDDSGEMKSGGWIQISLYVLSVISVICFVAATVFFFRFSSLSNENKILTAQLSNSENKIDHLTDEKEVLMARLVISGKEPGIQADSESESSPAIEETVAMAKLQTPEKLKKEVVAKTNHLPKTSTLKSEKEEADAATPVAPIGAEEKIALKPAVNKPKKESEPKSGLDEMISIPKTVTIEKFTVKKDGSNNDLVVRFDIRNVSNKPGDVSGRIFTVLKPDNGGENGWLVVPQSELKNGMPLQPGKGQPFSIAHFKPVKFKIKNQPNPDFFKKASIFVFNKEAQLIFKKQINITDAE